MAITLGTLFERARALTKRRRALSTGGEPPMDKALDPGIVARIGFDQLWASAMYRRDSSKPKSGRFATFPWGGSDVSRNMATLFEFFPRDRQALFDATTDPTGDLFLALSASSRQHPSSPFAGAFALTEVVEQSFTPEGEADGTRTIYTFGPTHPDLGVLRVPVVWQPRNVQVAEVQMLDSAAHPFLTQAFLAARFRVRGVRYVA